LRWGKIRHEITFSRAFVKTLLKAAVVYLMAAVLSLLWLVVIVFGVPTNAALGFLALMSAIALVIGISLFTRWSKKTQTP